MIKKKLKSISQEDVRNHYKSISSEKEVLSIISYIKSLSFLLIKARNYEK